MDPLQSQLDYESLKDLLRNNPAYLLVKRTRSFIWSELTAYGPYSGRSIVDKSVAEAERSSRLGVLAILVGDNDDENEVSIEMLLQFLQDNYSSLSEVSSYLP